MRFIIAVDEKGVYLRKTLCVVRRGEIGEVHYYSKPIPAPRWFRPVLFVVGLLVRLIERN
jgi:hypothetical protein